MIFIRTNQIYRLSTKTIANPYKTLGLEKGASDEDIKQAYIQLAKQYHPDLKPQYADKFK